jgi:hypothetical protein
MRFGSFYVQVNNKKEEKTAGIIFHGGNALQFVLEKKTSRLLLHTSTRLGGKALDRSFLF